LAPNAGPIGGDGLAAPPLICSFTIADNSFAILFYLFICLVTSFHSEN
jgi:hypothetical protein